MQPAKNPSIALFTFHDDDLRHRPVRSFDMWLLNDLNGVERLWTKQFTIECAELICSPLIFRESDELLVVAADGRLNVQGFAYYATLVMRNIQSSSSLRK